MIIYIGHASSFDYKTELYRTLQGLNLGVCREIMVYENPESLKEVVKKQVCKYS